MSSRDDIKLTRKINIRFIMLTLGAIVVTVVLSVIVFYELFRKEIMHELVMYTHVLSNDDRLSDLTQLDGELNVGDGIRVTVISKDGQVIYDNEADIADMANHVNRPEIVEAFKNGSGEAVRQSETLKRSTFYYAVLLDSGVVLRLAKESDSIWSIFASAIPVMLIIMVLLVVVTILVTHYLTKSIVKPIEYMAKDMDHMDDIPAYKEIRPFIDTIKKQHEDIVKNAQIRQEFTANVSHELKTPLTSISGYSELIENGMATDADVHHFAAEIHRNSNRLLTLINDIIRLSELDVTEDVPTMESVDLYAIAQTAVDMLMINAEKHDVVLSLEGESSIITANRMMMEELVYNLTDNAIRYNNKNGYVKLTVHEQEDSVILKVKDTGIGIPEEHQELIFQRFYRVDKSRSKSTGGTGLGLAIVKHIVARHNANIDISSKVGVGTEITVTFKKNSDKI
ncbi:MAG: ATP-binding protein [Coprococcus sp.]